LYIITVTLENALFDNHFEAKTQKHCQGALFANEIEGRNAILHLEPISCNICCDRVLHEVATLVAEHEVNYRVGEMVDYT
jgi:hypothetical protein